MFKSSVKIDRHFGKLERFYDIVKSPTAHRLDRSLYTAKGCDKNDGDLGTDILEPIRELQTIDLRHLDVRDNDIYVAFLFVLSQFPAGTQSFKGLGRRWKRMNQESLVVQEVLEQIRAEDSTLSVSV